MNQYGGARFKYVNKQGKVSSIQDLMDKYPGLHQSNLALFDQSGVNPFRDSYLHSPRIHSLPISHPKRIKDPTQKTHFYKIVNHEWQDVMFLLDKVNQDLRREEFTDNENEIIRLAALYKIPKIMFPVKERMLMQYDKPSSKIETEPIDDGEARDHENEVKISTRERPSKKRKISTHAFQFNEEEEKKIIEESPISLKRKIPKVKTVKKKEEAPKPIKVNKARIIKKTTKSVTAPKSNKNYLYTEAILKMRKKCMEGCDNSARRAARIGQYQYGSKEEVFHGKAVKTKGGLTKDKLIMNKKGKIVSKAMSERGKNLKRRT